jgi:hypothetical protein
MKSRILPCIEKPFDLALLITDNLFANKNYGLEGAKPDSYEKWRLISVFLPINKAKNPKITIGGRIK